MNSTLFSTRLSFALLLVGSVGAFGCGDDSGMGTDGGMMVIDGGTGTDSGPDTDSGPGTDSGMTCRTPADYFTGMNNCTSDPDLAAVMREDYGALMDQSASEVAAGCARGMCLIMVGSPGFAGCVADCVEMGTDVSEGCSTCFAASVACSADNCLMECLSPATMAACDACRAGDNDCSANCAMMFYDCSGLPPPAADGGMPADGGT